MSNCSAQDLLQVLESIVDVWDDGHLAYEERTYEQGTMKKVIEEARVIVTNYVEPKMDSEHSLHAERASSGSTPYDQLQAWEELWKSIKTMEPELGDLNKPLAIAASYALLKQKERDFKIALTKIMDFTGGYEIGGYDISGTVERIARDAMRDNAPSTGESPHGLKETSPGRLGEGAPTGTDFYNQGFKDGISAGLKSRIQTEIYLEEARRELAVCLKQSGNWREFPSDTKYKLQYNKLTRKIDRVSLVTGLVADSFDPPEECY